jgi:CheY-like chemotaxis protein
LIGLLLAERFRDNPSIEAAAKLRSLKVDGPIRPLVRGCILSRLLGNLLEQENHTVLVVEDEFLIREDISTHLKDCGFNIIEAENATAAIQFLTSRNDIDIVFTDIRMPGDMDGIELARWIAVNYPNILVMIASGHVSREVAIKELCGVEAFVKPYKPEAISRKMRELLAHRKSNP